MIVKTQEEKQYWQLIKDIGSYNDKWADSVITKSDIISKLIKSLDASATTVLFTSFNPIALDLAGEFEVTIVCDKSMEAVFDLNNVIRVDKISDITTKFDIVLALDEYFTYIDSEQSQRELVEDIGRMVDGWLITTLQDYKNFAPYKKNQIDAIAVNGSNNYIMLENSIADKSDKQVWNHYWYCIKDHVNLLTIGPLVRRTMYFKQMAKYTSDAGGKQYVVQKNLLYKGFFSKNFEHIITVKF